MKCHSRALALFLFLGTGHSPKLPASAPRSHSLTFKSVMKLSMLLSCSLIMADSSGWLTNCSRSRSLQAGCRPGSGYEEEPLLRGQGPGIGPPLLPLGPFLVRTVL